MRSGRRHAPVKHQHTALARVILHLYVCLLQELKFHHSQTWLPTICRCIFQSQLVPKNIKIQQYGLRLRVSNALHGKLSSWVSADWKCPDKNFFQLNLTSPVQTSQLGWLSSAYANFMSGSWSHLCHLKKKSFWKKPSAKIFICVLARGFETMGQIPATTNLRKTHKTAAYVKIPMFFPTLLTKQLLGNTNHTSLGM